MQLSKHNVAFVLLALVTVFAHVAMSDSVTTTWIGGANGSFRGTNNWDGLVVPSENTLVACFTNSVTFPDENYKAYWYPAEVRLADGITVTANVREMPAPAHLPDGKWVWDIGEGSTYKSTYVFYGKPELTLVKKGAGTLESYWCGNGNNRFGDIDVQGGTLYTHYSSTQRVIPLNNLYIRDTATVKLINGNMIAMNGPLVTVYAGGVLDCGDKVQTLPGLAGSGTVTNASDGVRLTLEHSGQVFSGRIHGKLIVNPDANFATNGSYCVIGAADTLADADLEVVDVEGFENTVRFAAGIGTFYVKKWPDRIFYDMDGNRVTLKRSGRRWYVDASRTEQQGEGDGTTAETAFRTLKAAMENPALSNGDDVYALPGVYSNGVMGASLTRQRVSVPANVWLVSTEGAEKTFIVGANATNEISYGCGAGAVRCVSLAANARLEGFTLMGGRVDTNSTSGDGKGGGVYCADTSAHVVDCVFTNNVAYRGGAGHCGTYIRCRAYGNRCTQIGAVWNEHCNLYNCVTDGNLHQYSYYVAGNPAKIVNCTFGPNDAGSFRASGLTDAAKAHFYNSVFLSAPAAVDSSASPGSGSVMHRCIFAKGLSASYAVDDGCVVTDITAAADRLAFAGLGADLRPLSVASAVVDAGNDGYWNNPTKQESMLVDIDGNPRVQGRAIDIGAFEHDWHVDAACISAPGGGLAVAGAALGANSVTEGETLTFTITRTLDSAEICTGFTTNGVFVSFDDFPNGWTWTVDGSDGRTAMFIEAVYERPTEWFVDPVNGNDANYGNYRTRAKRTLAEVMTNTAVASGDVVWAAPGWYTNGVIEVKDSNLMQCNRVIVPAGVTLKSTAGAESTFIVGEPSPNAITNGCGPGAVRCVKMESGALVSGFTLMNGYVNCTSRTSGVNGGGVCGGTAEDCIIRNCMAIRGGGAHDSVCRRCRFEGNSASYIGSAANACGGLANCLFVDNSVGSYTTLNCYFVRNCTFLPGNAQATYLSSGIGYTPTNLYNCVILCSTAWTNSYTRCVFSNEMKLPAEKIGEGSIKKPLAELGLDEDGRPVSAASATVDNGSNAAYEFMNAGNADVAGNQRIYNGTIDIGCYEFDWRRDFTRAIGSLASLSVASASPSVTTNAVGGLLLPDDGAALDVVWSDAGIYAKKYSLTAQVTGTGTLSIFRDGAAAAWAEVSEADGATTLWFESDAAMNSLSFAFSGEGSAVLSRFSKRGGAVIIVR